tara:strand:+ start:1850 stop:2473 length:624 start_codon:yes stop_codon:yes gene_type:complete
MLPNLYPYQEVEKALNAFFKARSKELLLRRAYRRFKCLINMLAVVEYGMFDTEDEKEREKAVSFVWEDMDLAFRGYGDNCTTGFVMQLWSVLPKEDWPKFKELLEDCLGRARKEAERRGVKPRYSHKYLCKPVRDLDEDFCLPTALPLSGPVVRDWAIDHDHDPIRIEEAMLYLETVDRLKNRKKAANDSQEARAKFEILDGGKQDG